ncbi:hypothetical protein DICVIV_01291 [Dictyocaulus viviparus]|uniref:Uncharacterized protein n=1 Tax=Dictyocaulus viviparus TaxID=29172 RepID=A0A0D8YCY2_DICVI|nr:hypothetical protein DICVIV_01291 [Dictyocaulus viviparus]
MKTARGSVCASKHTGMSDCNSPLSILKLLPSRLRFSKWSQLAMSDISLDIHAWRAEYLNNEEPFLEESKLPTHDPFKLFDMW